MTRLHFSLVLFIGVFIGSLVMLMLIYEREPRPRNNRGPSG
jgi:hypothetical protein